MSILSKLFLRKDDDSKQTNNLSHENLVINKKLDSETGLLKTLEDIQSGNENSRRRAINRLYDRFIKQNEKRIRKNGVLSEEDILDAYTDAFMAAIKAISNGSFRGEAKLSTFFYSILRRKLMDRLRVKYREAKKWQKIDSPASNTVVEGEEDMSASNISKVSKEVITQGGELVFVDPSPSQEIDLINNEIAKLAMEKLDMKSRKILLDKAKGYNMKELAAKNGLKNAKSASQTYYTCKKKLIVILNELSSDT